MCTCELCCVDQCSKLRDHIVKVRDVLINKDEQNPETIRTATSELQQASLKLFEVAYKKVWFFLQKTSLLNKNVKYKQAY